MEHLILLTPRGRTTTVDFQVFSFKSFLSSLFSAYQEQLTCQLHCQIYSHIGQTASKLKEINILPLQYISTLKFPVPEGSLKWLLQFLRMLHEKSYKKDVWLFCTLYLSAGYLASCDVKTSLISGYKYAWINVTSTRAQLSTRTPLIPRNIKIVAGVQILAACPILDS